MKQIILKNLGKFSEIIDNSKLKVVKDFLFEQSKIFVLATKGFVEDKVQLRASALTFFSVLSFVPILALTFAIAKGFGYDENLRKLIADFFSEFTATGTDEGGSALIDKIIQYAENLLENTKEGYVAGVGSVVLFWSIIKVFGNIEHSFNGIWQIKKSRSIFRKFSDYLALLIISSMLLLISTGLNVRINIYLTDNKDDLQYFSNIGLFLLRLAPYVMIWCVFTMLYMVMPNTRVRLKNAMIAGIIAGTLFQLLEFLYVNVQVNLFSSSYGAIYGSFAILPLFLMWLQFSWFIVLFGAEISYAYQNIKHYELENETHNISNHQKRIICVLIIRKIIDQFQEGKHPLSAAEISESLNLPMRLVRDLIFIMLETKLLSETYTNEEKVIAYQPAFDIHKMTAGTIYSKIDRHGNDDEYNVSSPNVLQSVMQLEVELASNEKLSILVKDL